MLSLGELLGDSVMIAECSLVKDRRRIDVMMMTFGKARLVIGRPVPHTDEYFDQEDGWCYLSHKAALDALKAWNPAEDKEPDGWSRHVSTGRYRIDGRSDLEYVKNDYSKRNIEEMVAYALSVTHREDRVIKELKRTRPGSIFPADTERFVVMSESPQCPHDPKCLPIDHVYQRFDRWVVLSTERFLNTTVDNVLCRLTGELDRPWEERNLGYLAELYGMTVVRLD